MGTKGAGGRREEGSRVHLRKVRIDSQEAEVGRSSIDNSSNSLGLPGANTITKPTTEGIGKETEEERTCTNKDHARIRPKTTLISKPGFVLCFKKLLISNLGSVQKR